MNAIKNVMFGLTHDADTGEQIIRLPRTCKVSIGIPAGPQILVSIVHDKEGNDVWRIAVGKDQKYYAKTKQEARDLYEKHKQTAPDQKFPAKLPYFTFRRTGADGESLEPDFDAIERHGRTPTVLPVVLTEASPLEGNFTWWGSGKRKCWGDGINAMRLVELAAGTAQAELAEKAKKAGERYFPIIEGCRDRGCPHARPTVGKDGREKAPECKPFSRLSFQLTSLPHIGARCEFVSTAFETAAALSSSLAVIEALMQYHTGMKSAVGVPLYLIVRPYTTNYGGKRTKAWAVHLEMRPDTLENLAKKLQSYAPKALLEAGPEPESSEPVEATAAEVAAIEAEFLPREDDDLPLDDADGLEPETPSRKTAAATHVATEELAEEVSGEKEPAPPVAEKIAEVSEKVAAATPPKTAPAATQKKERMKFF